MQNELRVYKLGVHQVLQECLVWNDAGGIKESWHCDKWLPAPLPLYIPAFLSADHRQTHSFSPLLWERRWRMWWWSICICIGNYSLITSFLRYSNRTAPGNVVCSSGCHSRGRMWLNYWGCRKGSQGCCQDWNVWVKGETGLRGDLGEAWSIMRAWMVTAFFWG